MASTQERGRLKLVGTVKKFVGLEDDARAKFLEVMTLRVKVARAEADIVQRRLEELTEIDSSLRCDEYDQKYLEKEG